MNKEKNCFHYKKYNMAMSCWQTDKSRVKLVLMKNILDFLACQKCLGELSEEKEKIVCKKCGSSFDLKNNKYYFTQVKKDINPSTDIKITDSKKWTEWRKKNFVFFETELKNIPFGSYVLDIGAGKAHFKTLLKNMNYLAMDFFDYEPINVVTDITKQLPFQSNKFDCLILSNVLEHVSEPQALLKECLRILKKDGILLMTVPFFIKIHQEPYDFYRYTPFCFEYLLSQAGFVKTRVENIGDIFDIYKVIKKELFNVVNQNLTKNIKSRYLRIIPRVFLKIFEISINTVFQIIKSLKIFTKAKKEKTNYSHGYGVVAKK